MAMTAHEIEARKQVGEVMFKALLMKGYNETDAYILPLGQKITLLSKDGHYALYLEHRTGFQMFSEVNSMKEFAAK